ncbi:MAG: alpha-1,4-glucan--maltose-1-phosphate maltosyltransferase, partial [Armatimonadetes bacterium]|nr:alpha-1,4-glucan--maltose-1-phosphate maltosyltransferase [Armatimonadota bacterium]
MEELTQGETARYLRPNFFTNTPDVLPQELTGGGENAYLLRYALAATLSSNCGVYGPVFELMENADQPSEAEKYLPSEKYGIHHHHWKQGNRLTDFITEINRLRKAHPALQDTFNLTFTRADNDNLMSFVKATPDHSSIIWCIINLDPHNVQT